MELLQGERSPSPTLTKEEAGQAAVRAMERSQQNTARRYLKLLRWLLAAIGGWCLLSCLPLLSILFPFALGYHPAGIEGAIGGADGPTAVLTATAEPMFPPQVYLAIQLIALTACMILAVRVWKVERRLK